MSLLRALARPKRRNESYLKYVTVLLHLWIGLLTGLIICVVSLTGALYVFKAEITTLVDRRVAFRDRPASRLASLDAVAGQYELTYGQAPSRITILPDPKRNLIVEAGRGGERISAYFDRETGAFAGLSSPVARDAFSWVLHLHRWLLVRGAGKTVVGVCTLLFLFMLLSGLVLWFPSRARKVKQAFTIKTDGSPARLNYDLHNVIGFYSLIGVFLVAATGLCFSFGWFREGMVDLFKSRAYQEEQAALLEQVTQGVDEEMDALFDQFLAEADLAAKKPAPPSLDALLAEADRRLPYAAETRVSPPGRRSDHYVVRKVNTGNWLGAELPDEVHFDPRGEVLEVDRFREKPLALQVSSLILPLHTGEILGTKSQIFYLLLALISFSLPITGFLIWWNKAKKRLLTERRKHRGMV